MLDRINNLTENQIKKLILHRSNELDFLPTRLPIEPDDIRLIQDHISLKSLELYEELSKLTENDTSGGLIENIANSIKLSSNVNVLSKEEYEKYSKEEIEEFKSYRKEYERIVKENSVIRNKRFDENQHIEMFGLVRDIYLDKICLVLDSYNSLHLRSININEYEKLISSYTQNFTYNFAKLEFDEIYEFIENTEFKPILKRLFSSGYDQSVENLISDIEQF